jgi:putative phosphoesterase
MNIHFPPHLSAGRIIARIGLISDTHMPQRCPALPPSLFDVLHGVDLLLHAGDVGELWVLDRLSAIAPLIAVHGNDDSAEAQRELPYQQLIAVAGQRILLWHSHYADRQEEMDSRRDNALPPKLAHIAACAQRTGSTIVVFGHWHIPLTYQHENVLLINPGAIASGNPISRQLRLTVALLFLRDDGRPFVSHVDLAAPDRPYAPRIDWAAGFPAALAQFSASILDPEIAADFDHAVKHIYPLAPEPFLAALLRVAHRCWAGAQPFITRADLLAEVRQDLDIPSEIKAQFEVVMNGK